MSISNSENWNIIIFFIFKINILTPNTNKFDQKKTEMEELNWTIVIKSLKQKEEEKKF